MKKYQWFIFATVILSVVSLFLEQIPDHSAFLTLFSTVIDFTLMAVVLAETLFNMLSAKYKRFYIKDNLFSLLFTLMYFGLFIYSKFIFRSILGSDLAIFAILLRNVFIVLKIYGRAKKFSAYIEKFTSNPAQSILLSFVFVILAGTLVLMMSFSTRDGNGLSFIDALFTATSATCVTGLVVVDTAVVYTFWGQLAVLALVQIGGLGIMLLSFFTVFLIGKRVSLQDKMLLSYMLNEDDTSNLRSAVLGIALTTFVIEGIGASVLFVGFFPSLGFTVKNLWFSIFHSISAFCNGGFALYSDSLESFRLNPLITLAISFLIILGGIGFGVIGNVKAIVKERIDFLLKKRKGIYQQELSLNSRIVLIATFMLLLIGTLLFYILEHDNVMASYSLGEQYLAAFFQSVTVRTAGFNSVPYGSLRNASYMFMCVFMFIGAASGSTAGGIKVNTLVVIIATIKSFLRGDKNVYVNKFQVSDEKVRSALVICISGLTAAFCVVFILSITEHQPIQKLIFEVFSAIGTAGVTAGITGDLSGIGKISIIMLMFWGRLGAITILSSATTKTEKVNISWPQAEISIG